MPSRIKGTPDVCFEHGRNAVADPKRSYEVTSWRSSVPVGGAMGGDTVREVDDVLDVLSSTRRPCHMPWKTIAPSASGRAWPASTSARTRS
jgi:hypothetical protein